MKINKVREELNDIEWYSPTVPKNWQEYHATIRELCNMFEQSVLNYYNDWIGFKLTLKQFRELLDEELRMDIEDMGEDTCNREAFMDKLALKITGQTWPLGRASKEEVQKFCDLMKIRGREMGYDIPDDFTL